MSQRKGAAMAAVTSSNSKHHEDQEMLELRRGPWTLEEDNLLMNYIACHGEGRWNLLARCSGLKRTGKSCRLRWLNYLKPDIKRGNLTPEEQLLILELHSKWGNRWSRIAQHLPGRTDNEIKNYWRTRVQKQARQLRVDANSAVFRDAVRCYWMPRLLEKMAATHNHGDLPPPPPPLHQHHPSHIAGGTMAASSSPVHHDTGGQYLLQRYHHQQPAVVDPSPSTSATSGSAASAAALAPVPCFSELSWADQYGGPYGYSYAAADLDGGAGAFDGSSAAALEGLGLDGLDLGPADSDVYSDTTLLDYLNSTCAAGGTVMATVMGGGGGGGVHSSCGGAMGGGGGNADYYAPPSSWRTDELGGGPQQHQWGGGI